MFSRTNCLTSSSEKVPGPVEEEGFSARQRIPEEVAYSSSDCWAACWASSGPELSSLVRWVPTALGGGVTPILQMGKRSLAEKVGLHCLSGRAGVRTQMHVIQRPPGGRLTGTYVYGDRPAQRTPRSPSPLAHSSAELGLRSGAAARLGEGPFRWADTPLLPGLQCEGLLSSPNPAWPPWRPL